MKFDLIIVRYGEIFLKSRYVRKKFERILVGNIKTVLKKEKIENKIIKEWGRIYIYTDQIKQTLRILKRIFGIVNFSPSVKTSSNLNSISKKAVSFSKKYINKNMSFALRTNRSGDQNYTSQDVAVKIGRDIVENIGSSVDLSNPDFELFIDVRQDNAYIFKEKISGSGGMPADSQDRVLCIIDNVYSIVSSWYLLRRGCKVLFFTKKGFDKNLLDSFLEKWYIDEKIVYYTLDNNFFKTINKVISEHKCKAVVTSFFDLKNDLSSIKTFKKKINVTILHPLISMNKNDIKNKIEEIGVNI